MGELALIVFTLFMQGAIGALAFVTIYSFMNKKGNFFLTYCVIAGLSIVAVLASLLHLGQPLGAMNSLLNMGNSWLSREILFTGAFTALAFALVILARTKIGGEKLTTIVSGVAVIVGLIDVFCMAQIYMNTVIPAWASLNTLIDFLATTVILGAAIFYLTAGKENLANKTAYIGWSAVAAAIIQVVSASIYFVGLSTGNGFAVETAMMLAQDFSIMLAVKWVLILAGAILMALPTIKTFKNANVTLVAAVVAMIGLVVGRYIFYTAFVVETIGIM